MYQNPFYNLYVMQAINFSSFAFLESRLSSALVSFLWGASSGTLYVKNTGKMLKKIKCSEEALLVVEKLLI
jgi:hypothetical protein